MFEDWKKVLLKNGCEIVLDSAVEHFTYKNNLATEAVCKDKTYKADCIVTALSPYDPLSETPELAATGHQLQCSVIFALNTKLKGTLPTMITLPDSPWFLLVRAESNLWDVKQFGCEEILTVGFGFTHVPGFNGKAWEECSVEEAGEEVFN